MYLLSERTWLFSFLILWEEFEVERGRQWGLLPKRNSIHSSSVPEEMGRPMLVSEPCIHSDSYWADACSLIPLPKARGWVQQLYYENKCTRRMKCPLPTLFQLNPSSRAQHWGVQHWGVGRGRVWMAGPFEWVRVGHSHKDSVSRAWFRCEHTVGGVPLCGNGGEKAL